MKKVVILHNAVKPGDSKDVLDVMDQVDVVKKALSALDYTVYEIGADINLQNLKDILTTIHPAFVFNLVEMMNGKGEFHYIIPAFLSSMEIPYTGSAHEAMIVTSGKVLAKTIMKYSGIPTADWLNPEDVYRVDLQKKYIIKPIWEDASVGIEEDMVFNGDDPELINVCKKLQSSKFFIEEFIKGREFNISILGGPEGPQVLPPAELLFINYPEDKPTIAGYNAKWNEDTFEFLNTQRSFNFTDNDMPLLEQLKQICLRCWHVFKLKGYVRVDFRVDSDGQPFVLEINANPCISPDAGFYAATQQAKLDFTKVMENIIFDALNN